MNLLIPVQYHSKKYPEGIEPKLYEKAGHFDVSNIDSVKPVSLHTEYSFGKRKLDNHYIKQFSQICNANKDGVPMLWYDKIWAAEFADYICGFNILNLQVIEIHPPFSDYSNLNKFFSVYNEFEITIKNKYPNVQILIENRYGTLYPGGKFILRNVENLQQFSKLLDKSNLNLKITLDIPQLFTAHRIKENKVDDMQRLLWILYIIRHNIKGIHLWGKKKGKNGRTVAHSGNLDTFFNNNIETKEHFLRELYRLFNDDIERYFVPEVNSANSDFVDIILDLICSGFIFT